MNIKLKRNLISKKFLIILIILIQFQGCDWFFGPGCGDPNIDGVNTTKVIELDNYNFNHIEIFQIYRYGETQPAIKEIVNDSIFQIQLFLSGNAEFGTPFQDFELVNDTLSIWYSPYLDSNRTNIFTPCRFRKMACSPIRPEIEIDSIFIYKPTTSNVTYTVNNEEFLTNECPI